MNPPDYPFHVVDRRKRGYYTIDNLFLDAYGKKCGPFAIAVYNALARFANEAQECWPSRNAIHDRTGVSLSQINRELNKLVDLNLILITPQFNEQGEQTSNLYILLEVLDPLVSGITPPLSRRQPPLVRLITKQSLKKKDTSNRYKKKDKSTGKVSYNPADYGYEL